MTPSSWRFLICVLCVLCNHLGGSEEKDQKLTDASLRHIGVTKLTARLVKAAEVLIKAAMVSEQVHGPWCTHLLWIVLVPRIYSVCSLPFKVLESGDGIAQWSKSVATGSAPTVSGWYRPECRWPMLARLVCVATCGSAVMFEFK
jgi:hypothetical protein